MHTLFRFDASSESGLGHQSRCLALASCLHDSSADNTTVFGETLGTLPLWINHRQPTDTAGGPAEFLQLATAMCADLAIVDKYGLSNDWFAQVRSTGLPILRLLDSPVALPESDFVLDPSPAHSDRDYDAATSTGCEVMVGSRWAPIGHAFFNERHLARRHFSECPHILVSMGGSDPTGAAMDILRGLEQFPTALRLTVMATRDPAARSQLERQARASRHEVTVSPPSTEMARLTSRFDAAVGAGGVSALERCVVGLPSVLVATASNQLPNVSALVSAGAAARSGRDESSLMIALHQVLNSRDSMSAAARSVCDGLGALRCARALGGTPSVRLRQATPADKFVVHGHQRIPAIRRWFRQPEVPSSSEHSTWFDSALRNPAIELWLIESAGFVLGHVRTDADGDGRREVSILVVPEAQGMGIATAALKALRDLSSNTLVADIHPDNRASITAFTRAGFHHVCERQYESEVHS